MSVPYAEILAQAPGDYSTWSDLPGIKSGNPFDGSGVYNISLDDGHTFNPQIGIDPRLYGSGNQTPAPNDPTMSSGEKFRAVNNTAPDAPTEAVGGVDVESETFQTWMENQTDSDGSGHLMILAMTSAAVALAYAVLGGN